jgi:hypothetical protein
LAAQVREQGEEQERRKAWRASAEARRERAASRGAYRGLGRAAALAAVRTKHDGFLGVGWRPFVLGQGERVRRYLADGSAQVELANGRLAVARSSLPMRDRAPDGSLAPLDFGLTERPAGFGPRNSLSDVAFPDRADRPARFVRLDLGLSYKGATAAPGEIAGGSVFYANVDEDTDLLLQPGPLGAGAFVQLRSPASTERPTLDLGLPPGARLRRAPTPPGLSGDVVSSVVQVVRDSDVIAEISPPAAWDAQQRPIPVGLDIVGTSIVLEVDHRDEDYAYPILVDPWVMDRVEGWSTAQSESGGWVSRSTRPGIFGLGWADMSASYSSVDGPGLFVYSWQSPDYYQGDSGEWFWRAPANTYIFQADFTTTHNPAHLFDVYRSSTFHGIVRDNGWETGWWGRLSSSTCCSPQAYGSGPPIENYPLANAITFTCVVGYAPVSYHSSCDENSGTEGNYATAGLVMNLTGGGVWTPSSGWLDLRSSTIFLQDRNTPTIAAVNHSNPVPTGWVTSYSDTVSATTHDDGLGMSDFSLTTPKIGDGTNLTETRHSCVTGDGSDFSWGNRHNRCPHDWTTPGLSYSTAMMPEGTNTVSVGAKDIVATQASPRLWTIKVDRTNPVLSVDGDVRWADEDGWLSGGHHEVWAGVDDFDASGGRGSGAKRVELYVDGVIRGSHDFGCSSECPDSDEYTFDFDADTYPAGQHALEVRAADAVGHVVSESWTIGIDNAPPTMAQSGTLSAAALAQTPLTLPGYHLATIAQDGGPLQAQSGVERITTSVNGWLADVQEQTCDAGSCQMTQTWEYKPLSFGTGPNTVTTTVTDAAGNESKQSLVVTQIAAMDCDNRIASAGGQPCVEDQTSCTANIAAAPAPSSPPATPDDVVTPTQARAGIEASMPAMLNPSTDVVVAGATLSPTVQFKGAWYLLSGTHEHGGLPRQPPSGLAVGWGPDRVCLQPMATDTAASEASVVNGDALVFANTHPAVDTVLRPDIYGVKMFLQLRNAHAPEAYKWKVSLPTGSSLQQVDSRTVAITGAEDPFEGAGSAPSIPAPADATDRARIPNAAAQATDGTSLLDAVDWYTGDRTRAVITAPWATAADGATIPISLTANPDDTITLAVSHRSQSRAYPATASASAKTRADIRTTTWNYGVRSTAFGTRAERNADLAKHGSQLIALQDICYQDSNDVLSALGGSDRYWKRSEKLFTQTVGDPRGWCTRSNIIFASKDYPVNEAQHRTFQVYVQGSEPPPGKQPARCLHVKRRTMPDKGWPRCFQRLVVRREDEQDDVAYFNVHYGRHYAGARRSPPAYRYIANRVSDSVADQKVVMGDFNAVHQICPERSVMEPFRGDPLHFAEADQISNRGTFWGSRIDFGCDTSGATAQVGYYQKRDYVFYGPSPASWSKNSVVVRGRSALATERGYSDHRSIRTRLVAP